MEVSQGKLGFDDGLYQREQSRWVRIFDCRLLLVSTSFNFKIEWEVVAPVTLLEAAFEGSMIPGRDSGETQWCSEHAGTSTSSQRVSLGELRRAKSRGC